MHHPTKANNYERGHGALRGAVDTLMQLDQADDLVRLSCEKQKDAALFDPIDVKLVPTPRTTQRAWSVWPATCALTDP